MTNVLEVERLSVRLGRHAILRDLSFAVKQGSSLAIIGPNGSGKTVLFKTLIGALKGTGEIRWAAGTRTPAFWFILAIRGPANIAAKFS